MFVETDLLCNLGAIEELMDQLQQDPHTSTHELITQALLNIVQDYPPAQAECLKPAYKLKELILRRKSQLAGDEAYQVGQ